MQTTKHYTNQTFTRHVDDEKGRDRTLRSLPEPAVCEVCSDVYADRRWTKPDAERRSGKHKQFRAAKQVVCPACERQRGGVPSGYVYVQGKFFATYQDEIKRLLENEAERAAEDNPLARIMEWQAGTDGTLTVTTTTEHLARRLGRALNKAFRGKVRYGVRVKREAVLVHLVFGTHGQNAFWRTFGDEQPRFPAADHRRNPPPFKIKRDLAQFFVPLRVRVLNREQWCDGVLEQDN